MLVLSRKRDEEVVIGDSIIVGIVDIRGDKVRLGIQAPRDVPVHRREVAEQIGGNVPERQFKRGQFCPDCGKRVIECRCSNADAVARKAVAR